MQIFTTGHQQQPTGGGHTMNFDWATYPIDPDKRDDLTTFLETGIASEESLEIFQEDILCQEVIDMYLHFEEGLLLLAETKRKIDPLLHQVDPKWHNEFRRFFITFGEPSDAFIAYVEKDKRCQAAMVALRDHLLQDMERQKEEDEKTEVMDFPNEMAEFLWTMEDHRQRWLKLGNL